MSLARDCLGWRAAVDLDAGLARTVEWIRGRGPAGRGGAFVL